MTSYNHHREEQAIVYRKYDSALSQIQTQYKLFENLLEGKTNSITISLKDIIRNVVCLYAIRKDILSLPSSADTIFDDNWEILAKKYGTEVTLNDFLPQMKIDIGDLLYSYLSKVYNAFPCENFTCTRDFTKGYEYYHISEGNVIGIGSGLKDIFNDLRRLLNALELLLKIFIITPNTFWGLPKKDFPPFNSLSTRRNPIHQKQAPLHTASHNITLKLNNYKKGATESKYIKNGQISTRFENEFISFDCYETSNKHGITSKMWSFIYYPKKDFKHLHSYIELSTITSIKITKVRDNSGRWAIRFYDMTKNPEPEFVTEILNYIFKK